MNSTVTQALDDLLQQAVACHHAGQLQEAECFYRAILQARPDHPDVNDNLKALAMQAELIALFTKGRFAEAETLAHTMTEGFPHNGFGWVMLGMLFRRKGRSADALAFIQKGVELSPDYAAAHNNLGIIFCDFGRLNEAEASYRRALQIKPNFVEAHNNLGSVLCDLGRLMEAEASCRRALEIKADNAEAHNNLGGILHKLGRLDEAEASCRYALQIRPNFSEAACSLCTILKDMGRFSEAEASYRRTLEIKPDFAEAYCRFGSFLLELGRADEAEANLYRALEIKPDLIEARYAVALSGKAKPDDENLAALLALNEDARNSNMSLRRKDAIYLHFALGKCYGDIGDHEKAFPHFDEGCKLKRATLEYNPDQTAQYLTRIMHIFDKAAIDRLRGGGSLSRVPIFILGMPRSGTTLTEQIIASHPEVHGAGELPDLIDISVRNVAGTTFPDNLRLLDQAQLTAWGVEYVAGLLRRAPDARRITDKMPENFLAIGLIHLMLPNAKIIHVNRNPVDTCLSCFTTLFEYVHEHTYDLAELGQYYAGYARLMEHWRKVLPEGAFLDVRYEDIVADQEGQSRRILDYCGLEWDDACLDFHRSKRVVQTASLAQVRQPMYKSSVERWRPYEKHLKPLFDALGDLATGR